VILKMQPFGAAAEFAVASSAQGPPRHERQGGSSFFYFVGTYRCSGGKWKGELTQGEHTPAPYSFATAGKIVTAGFTGTYTDEVAEFEATALVGKRSLRYHANMRLLIPV
jgi:hypothetical protein